MTRNVANVRRIRTARMQRFVFNAVPNALGGFLLIHKSGFVVWLAVAALDVVGHHAVRTSDGLGSHRGEH